MPNIIIKVPSGVFTAEQRKALAKKVNGVAAAIEQMPNQPKQLFLNWIAIDESAPDMFTCGGFDVTTQVLPCIVMIYLPAGILDAASRARYVSEIHAALLGSISTDDKRQLASSVILHEITDGQWGANGNLWRLPNFAKAAGYAHLQHLTA